MTACAESHASQLQAVAERKDKQAFAELFAHFAPRLKTWLMKGGADETSAEEVAQETMLTVWHRAQSYRPDRAAVSTWVFRIARNKRIDRLRKERRPMVDLDDPAVVKAPPEKRGYSWDIIAGEENRLRREIDALPQEQSHLLRMFYVEDKSHRIIAEELNIALGTVKSRIRLALGRLRNAYKDPPEASA